MVRLVSVSVELDDGLEGPAAAAAMADNLGDCLKAHTAHVRDCAAMANHECARLCMIAPADRVALEGIL